MKAIRGATTVAENSDRAIRSASESLWHAIVEQNKLSCDEIVSVILSTTDDITAAYPAKWIRLAGCSAPLFSCLEPPIDGALPMCLRCLVTVNRDDGTVKHCYLGGAKILRPDLAED